MKRSPSPTPTTSSHHSDADFTEPVNTPSPSKKTKTSPSAKTTPTKASPSKKLRAGPSSDKGKLVAIIIERGVKGMDKAEAEKITGLKAAQIKQLLRTDGKGGVYNALMKVAEEM